MCMQCAGNICGLEPCQVKPYFRTVVMVVSGEGGGGDSWRGGACRVFSILKRMVRMIFQYCKCFYLV